MAGFVVYQDSYIGATIVSNRFIDEYMTDANDAQLKVYLYLVRMLNAHLETSVSDIADRFNHTEKDVLRAFKYWEKQGLLTLDYDEKGVLTGVHLVNLCSGEAKVPSVEATHKKVKVTRQKESEAGAAAGISNAEAIPVASVINPVTTENSVVASVINPVAVENSAVTSVVSTASVISPAAPTNTVPMAGGEISIVPRPVYSIREIQEFSKTQGCTLVSLAEVYFGRPLTPSDLQTLCYMNDGLGMSEDLIDYLLQYCADKGKKDFRYAEKVAIGWKEKNITSVEQASGNSLKYDKSVYTIMNRLGKSGSPTSKEMEFITRWTEEYGFSENVILEACDRTVMATDSHRFQYAEGILSNWNRSGIKTLDDIARLDEDYQKKDQAKNASVASGSRQTTGRNGGGNSGSFGKFQQADIDLDALSKKIFIN